MFVRASDGANSALKAKLYTGWEAASSSVTVGVVVVAVITGGHRRHTHRETERQ